MAEVKKVVVGISLVFCTVTLASWCIANFSSYHSFELDELRAIQLASDPSAPIDTSNLANSKSQRQALELAEGLIHPGVSMRSQGERMGTNKALELAESPFSEKKYHLRTLSRIYQHSAKTSQAALALASSSFERYHTQQPKVSSPNEEMALRLADGEISSSERKAIADEDMDEGPSIRPTHDIDLQSAKEFASASERRALRLAEGRLSSRQAEDIADGGVGDWSDSKSSLSSSVDGDEFHIPSDEDTERAIVFGRPNQRHRAVHGLLRTAARMTGGKAAHKRTTTEAAAAAHRAAAAAALKKAGGGRRALRAINVITRDAQTSLGDVLVPANHAVHRGWGGF